MPKVNLPILFIAFLWWFMENSYFGWNAIPVSNAELFAGGLGFCLAAAAFAFPPHSQTTVINIKSYSRGE